MFKRYRIKLSPKIQEEQMDLPLVITTVLLVILGLIIVYDASVVQAYKDFGDKYAYIRQQSIWVLLGLPAMFFFSRFKYSNLRGLSLPIFLISVLLLIAVLVPGFGIETGGAHRWLKVGPMTIQPAEIIKLSSIIFLASVFAKKGSIQVFAIVVFGISFVIGFAQRDLGTTIVYFLSCLSIYIASGAPLKYFGTLAPISVLGLLVFALSSEYRKNRILAFLDPFADPQKNTYHISQILIALGSGGFFGVGIGQSRQKFEYIPEVTTDSIFAIVGEEFGFFGAIILIGLISFLIYRGFKIAEKCPDKFGKLLSFGITCWLGFQAAVNLASMVSLIPLTGVPLPFISYGGSALLTNLVGVGILLNISKTAKN